MMYKCNDCGNIIENDDDFRKEYTTYESYYGVSSLFPDSHSMTLYKCPYCGSEDYDEYTPPKEVSSEREFVELICELLEIKDANKIKEVQTKVANNDFKDFIDKIKELYDSSEEDVRAVLEYAGEEVDG